MKSRRLSNIFLIFLLSCLLSACSGSKPLTTVYWPVPPSEPKLQWFGTYYSQDNFPKSGFQIFLEGIVGKPTLATFIKPGGIASSGNGIVYVADTDANNLRVYDFNKKTVDFFSKNPIFNRPTGLALDSSNRLYVSDGTNKQIRVFAPDRNELFAFGGDKVLTRPNNIAINETLGRIYVTDTQGDRVVVFDLAGKHLFTFGEGKEGSYRTFTPFGVAIDKDNRVFVSELLECRISVFDPDGKHLYSFGERGDRDWQLEAPRGLAFDSENHLYVVDSRQSALKIMDPADGTLLLTLGNGTTVNPLGFSLPTGIWIDRSDRIYVTDLMNLCFSMWQYLSPAWVKEHPLDQGTLEELKVKVEALKKKQELQQKQGTP